MSGRILAEVRMNSPSQWIWIVIALAIITALIALEVTGTIDVIPDDG